MQAHSKKKRKKKKKRAYASVFNDFYRWNNERDGLCFSKPNLAFYSGYVSGGKTGTWPSFYWANHAQYTFRKYQAGDFSCYEYKKNLYYICSDYGMDTEDEEFDDEDFDDDDNDEDEEKTAEDEDPDIQDNEDAIAENDDSALEQLSDPQFPRIRVRRIVRRVGRVGRRIIPRVPRTRRIIRRVRRTIRRVRRFRG